MAVSPFTRHSSYSGADVLVVGAGPAGATVATLLAKVGLRVTLLDRAAFPRHKPCGEYLSPGVVGLLHALGAGKCIEALTGARLRGFVVEAHGRVAMRGTFGQAAGWGSAPDYGLGLPRSVLDSALLDLARAAGADVREHVRVIDLLREGGCVTGVRALTPHGAAEFRARVVVGADGVRGVVARRLGLVQPRAGLRRIALVAHLDGMAGLTEFGEMHVGRAGYCGVAPHGPRLANVAMVLPASEAPRIAGRPAVYFQDALATFGDLGARGRNAAVVRDVLAIGPLAFTTRALTADGVLLIGDAGGYFDPFTGQGIYKALRTAQLAVPVLVDALQHDDVSRAGLLRFERAVRREFRGGLAVQWLVQLVLGRPRLFDRAIRLLGERPDMADSLVGVTGDVLPARRVLAPWFLARLAL